MFPVRAEAESELFMNFIMETFQNYEWIDVLVICLLALLLLFCVIAYQRLPLLGATAHRDREFWRAMPSNNYRYHGVLYSDVTIRTSSIRGPWYAVRRLVVLLKHEDASKDRTVFHNEETPNTHTIDDTNQAISTWIKTARKHDIPAVYRAGKGLHLLTSHQMEEMESDPVEFVGRFQAHIDRGKPLPDTISVSS
jgi:hypothetical protein